MTCKEENLQRPEQNTCKLSTAHESSEPAHCELLQHQHVVHAQSFDIESGCDTELLNLNPEGWIDGVSNERNWGMLYGMDVSWHRNLILAGDSHGAVHAVDPRANKPIIGKYQLHKKGNKVRGIVDYPANEPRLSSKPECLHWHQHSGVHPFIVWIYDRCLLQAYCS